SLVKFLNPSSTVCLYMHCEWITQLATATTERRLQKIDLVIGVSDFITEAIKRRFPSIASRCHTLHNGADIDRFYPLPGPAAREKPQRLLFAGRLSPEKGVHVLIRAFKILAKNRPFLRLDLVGPTYGIPPYIYLNPSPEDRPVASLEPFYGIRLADMVWRQLFRKRRGYLAHLVAEAGGDDRIAFHGPVLQTDTINFYRQAT